MALGARRRHRQAGIIDIAVVAPQQLHQRVGAELAVLAATAAQGGKSLPLRSTLRPGSQGKRQATSSLTCWHASPRAPIRPRWMAML